MQSRNRSDAILIISSYEDSNASPARNLSEAGTWKRFLTLGWQGSKRQSCKSASPSLQPPSYLRTTGNWHKKSMWFQWLCVRGTWSSPAQDRWHHKEVGKYVWIAVGPQCGHAPHMRKLVCASWTLAIPLRKKEEEDNLILQSGVCTHKK